MVLSSWIFFHNYGPGMGAAVETTVNAPVLASLTGTGGLSAVNISTPSANAVINLGREIDAVNIAVNLSPLASLSGKGSISAVGRVNELTQDDVEGAVWQTEVSPGLTYQAAILQILAAGGLSQQNVRDAMTLAPTSTPVTGSIDDLIAGISGSVATGGFFKRADSLNIITGTIVTGDLLSTYNKDDGLVLQISDDAGVIDVEFGIQLESNALANLFRVLGRCTGQNDNITAYLWNWVTSQWDQFFVISGTNGSGNIQYAEDTFAANTGTGVNDGQVRVRLYGTGLTSANLYIDRLSVGYGVKPASVIEIVNGIDANSIDLDDIKNLIEADEVHTGTTIEKRLKGTGTALLTKNWTGTPLSNFQATE